MKITPTSWRPLSGRALHKRHGYGAVVPECSLIQAKHRLHETQDIVTFPGETPWTVPPGSGS